VSCAPPLWAQVEEAVWRQSGARPAAAAWGWQQQAARTCARCLERHLGEAMYMESFGWLAQVLYRAAGLIITCGPGPCQAAAELSEICMACWRQNRAGSGRHRWRDAPGIRGHAAESNCISSRRVRACACELVRVGFPSMQPGLLGCGAEGPTAGVACGSAWNKTSARGWYIVPGLAVGQEGSVLKGLEIIPAALGCLAAVQRAESITACSLGTVVGTVDTI
jgi:hypothetical protein